MPWGDTGPAPFKASPAPPLEDPGVPPPQQPQPPHPPPPKLPTRLKSCIKHVAERLRVNDGRPERAHADALQKPPKLSSGLQGVPLVGAAQSRSFFRKSWEFKAEYSPASNSRGYTRFQFSVQGIIICALKIYIRLLTGIPGVAVAETQNYTRQFYLVVLQEWKIKIET